MVRKGYYLSWYRDARGRGNLELHQDSLTVISIACRTGSITVAGELVHALPDGRYYVTGSSVDTAEPAMIWPGLTKGWKSRLWRWDVGRQIYVFTHYLIHPDGGKGGTLGCLGTQTPGLELRLLLDNAVALQRVVPLYAGVPRPIDGYDDRQAATAVAAGLGA